MPPFFGNFGAAGAAGAWGLSAGSSEAEDDTNHPDGKTAEGNGDPELTKGKVEARELNIEEVPDPRKQSLSQGGGGLRHPGRLGGFFFLWGGFWYGCISDRLLCR